MSVEGVDLPDVSDWKLTCETDVEDEVEVQINMQVEVRVEVQDEIEVDCRPGIYTRKGVEY